MARYRNLALALAIAALLLVATVDAKARDKKEEKRLTSPPSKARTHPKPPPSAKDTPKEVKPPANSLPDLTTISKPGKPKHGGGPKQHTVVSYGPTPAKPAARKAPARKVPARKERKAHEKATAKQANPKAVNKGKGIPTLYRDRDGHLSERPPKVNRHPTARGSHAQPPPPHVRKQEAKAQKLFKHTATVQDIMKNPTKHKGVVINTHKGAPHPETTNKRIRAETAQAKAAAAAARARKSKDKVPERRKKPSAMTATMMAEEKRKADIKKAAKEFKRQKETAQKGGPGAMKNAAKEHLRQKQAAETKANAAETKAKSKK